MESQYFQYEKDKVIQALRYHFISRNEIKIMIIVVNVFAIISAILFFSKKISPLAFLISSVLWFALMISFWFLLPIMIYRRSKTFQDRFRAVISKNDFTIENERGAKSWQWSEFSSVMESPHFFHLYFDPRSFLIIPKEAFIENGIEEAGKILRKNICR
jgi:hypothetical protein